MRTNFAGFSKPGFVFRLLLWAGIVLTLLVSVQPWLKVVSSWVTNSIQTIPLIGPITDFLALLPFVGEPAAGVLLLLVDKLGQVGTLIIYAIVNFCQLGLFGGPRERAISYILEVGVNMLVYPIYGSGVGDIVSDWPRLDSSAWDYWQILAALFNLLAVEIVWVAAKKIR